MLQCRIGCHGTDPTEAVDRVTPEADCRALRVAGGERGAEHGRAVELGNPVRVRARRKLMGGVAGLALYDDTLRWRLPERSVDGHVGTDPVALEVARLEQHSGARVAHVDARPEVPRHRAREE